MKSNLSIAAALVVIASVLIIDRDLKLWQQEERIIEYDARIYYGYLPAWFIFDDLALEKSDYEYDQGKFWFWAVNTSKGKKVFKTTCGVALMQAPFFLIAHQVAQWYDYPVTGFSEPYKIFMVIGCAFYLFVGLIFLRMILLQCGFSDKVTALTLLTIGLSTNLIYYTTSVPLMSHAFSFALIAGFAYTTLRWVEQREMFFLAMTAIQFGLITLLRLSNAVVLLFFIIYAFRSVESLRKPRGWIMPALFLTLGTILAWIPQILYWKKAAGEFFVYTYSGEGFFWLDPKIKQVLIGFRRGWLIYTPVMIFSLTGLFLMRGAMASLRNAVVAVLLINLYVISSWWCWWYGGCFGQRAMVDSYALLAIPLAATVRYVMSRNVLVRFSGLLVGLFMTWLNIFQSYQYEHGGLHHDAMSSKAWIRQFGRLDPVPDAHKYLVYPDYEAALKGDR